MLKVVALKLESSEVQAVLFKKLLLFTLWSVKLSC